MSIKLLPFKNLAKRPLRTTLLILIAALMAAAVFGGSAAAQSLKNGLDSLEQRLGADIIVLPEDAEAKADLENILLQGTPGYFYMDKAVQEKVSGIGGIERISPQYFLVSANAECCTVQVQIIGFDEQSDFTIKPWLKETYSGSLKDNEIIVGSSLATRVGHTLKLYGVECKAVGKLDKTGTGLDTAIYTTPKTLRRLISAAEDKGIKVLSKQSPEDVISSLYIKVADGVDVSEVVSRINLEIDGVQAVRTKNMITGTADRLSVISGSISLLITAVWVLTALVMTAVFSVLAGVRRREFASLRVVGFSRRRLGILVMTESIFICILGAVIGVGAALVAVLPFGRLIELRTGLPYLSPEPAFIVKTALLAFLAVLVTGALTSLYSAIKLCHVDTGNILREGD